MSRCLMVSPPHLPTAHLLVRTVLALVCFPSPLVCSSIPYIKLSTSSSPPIHQPYPLNLLFSLLKTVLHLLPLPENSSSPAPPPSHCISLSRCSSHPALLPAALLTRWHNHEFQVRHIQEGPTERLLDVSRLLIG